MFLGNFPINVIPFPLCSIPISLDFIFNRETKTMMRDHTLVLCFALSFVIFSEASPHLSVVLGSSDPHEVRSFKVNHNHTQVIRNQFWVLIFSLETIMFLRIRGLVWPLFGCALEDFLWSEFGLILPNMPFVRTSRLYFTFVLQNARSCSYTVTVTTSCSSPDYTRDQISLSFGDAYGNQVKL